MRKTALLAVNPASLDKVDSKDIDKEILRLGIVAELDAVSLYEQLAARARNEKVKETLLDVAKEEKTHAGEFQSLLLQRDPEQAQELEEGSKEVAKISSVMMRAFMDELQKIGGIPTKLLLNPKFRPYFERVAKGGKDAPKLFKGGPSVHIPGVSPKSMEKPMRLVA